MKNINQLIFNFKHKKNFNFDDFYVSKSNYYAYKIIEKWPKWEKNILNIYGEKYSGKSHLVTIFIEKNKAIKVDKIINDENFFKKIKTYENIVIDNLNPDIKEEILFSLFNVVDQDNKYLVINSNKPINEINFKLNDLKSRSKNCLFAKIEKPDDELMFALILKSFSDKQISVDKKVIDFIIKRIDRSYSKIFEFIYKIDELSLKKKRPINLKTIKELL
tara:strand:- start:397 stop:1053 length:657 start_codon:yes stop_codon:yes gene_type:complete